MPAKGIRIEYWDGRSDKLEPLRKASEGIVMQNVRRLARRCQGHLASWSVPR